MENGVTPRLLIKVNPRPKNKVAFPFLLIGLVILIFACSSLKSAQTKPHLEPRETYLIPESFEGRFRIIYGETCGVEPKIENGKRILEIPNNRLLIIKPKFKGDRGDNEFFFVDSDGKRTKIVELNNYEQRRTVKPGIIMNVTSAIMTGAMPDGTTSSESPLAIHYNEFTVFNKDTTLLDQISRLKADMIFDPMMHDLVEDCRKKKTK